MAFTPSIDYVGHQTLRQKALGDVTRAKYTKKLKDEAEARRKAAEAAAAAAKRSRKVGMGRKIVGAIARGAAAYYTGGASEASGVGRMIDQQIQGGKDKEVNEYGEMVGAASTMSGMMTAKKVGAATTRLNAQAARDDAMQARMDKISPEAGLAFAEKIEAKNAKNRGVMDKYKDGFMNFGDVDGLDLSATTMDYSGLTKGKKIETTAKPVDTSPSSAYSPVSQLSTLSDAVSPTKLEQTQQVIEEDFEGKNVQGDPAAQGSPPVKISNIGGASGRDPDVREASEIKYQDTTIDNVGILGGAS